MYIADVIKELRLFMNKLNNKKPNKDKKTELTKNEFINALKKSTKKIDEKKDKK